MNLLSPAEVKRLLERCGLRPKKRLGQSFLIDRNVLQKILDAAGLESTSVVLEIGAGLGTVTQELGRGARKVVAVEADRDLIPVLQETTAELSSVEIVSADFLRLELPEFLASRFEDSRCIVVANLPYYITSPIIIRLIEAKVRLERMVLMVQEEVADRLTAAPASDAYGAFTVFVQYHCRVRTMARVTRTVFYPPPEVDSAIVRLDVRPLPAVSVPDEELFFRIVRAAFGQRRKTLVRALSGSPALGWSRERAQTVLAAARIDPGRRGETLSIDEFAALAGTAMSNEG